MVAMNDIVLYLIRSSILLALLTAFYMVFLRKETFHQFKRLYLQTAAIFALLIPALKFNVKKPQVFADISNQFNAQVFIPNPSDTAVEMSNGLSLQSVVLFIFFAFAGLLLFRMIIGLLKLAGIINSSKRRQLDIGVLAETKRQVSPFSFLKYIVLNPNLHSKKDQENIIRHEQVHVSQMHSIDAILAQIICMIQWFNPLAWLYKVLVMENLEFIADKNMLKTGCDKQQYQLSLLDATLFNNSMVFANHFNKLLIKKRITMMNKQLSNPANMFKSVLAIPLLFLFVFTFGQQSKKVDKTPPWNPDLPSTVISETLYDLGQFDSNSVILSHFEGKDYEIDEFNEVLAQIDLTKDFVSRQNNITRMHFKRISEEVKRKAAAERSNHISENIDSYRSKARNEQYVSITMWTSSLY